MQDGSCEFISLLAADCADGSSIPPALIYKGESRDLQDTWLEDFGEDQLAYFAASANGWSSDDYGLVWLEWVFDHHTKVKAGQGKQLLILDGQLSRNRKLRCQLVPLQCVSGMYSPRLSMWVNLLVIDEHL